MGVLRHAKAAGDHPEKMKRRKKSNGRKRKPDMHTSTHEEAAEEEAASALVPQLSPKDLEGKTIVGVDPGRKALDCIYDDERRKETPS